MSADALRLAAATIVVVPLVGYPAVVLADGARFPSPDGLRPSRRAGRPATSTSCSAAGTRRRRPKSCSRESSTSATSTPRSQEDGCLRWKVVYDGIESYEQGASSAAEARGAGLDAWLEIQPPG